MTDEKKIVKKIMAYLTVEQHRELMITLAKKGLSFSAFVVKSVENAQSE